MGYLFIIRVIILIFDGWLCPIWLLWNQLKFNCYSILSAYNNVVLLKLGKDCRSVVIRVFLTIRFSSNGPEGSLHKLLLKGNGRKLVDVIGKEWELVSGNILDSTGDLVESFKCTSLSTVME